jgi:hypothetical protein
MQGLCLGYRGATLLQVDNVFGVFCNTSGVTMARAHLCTNDCDHMWKKLKEKGVRSLGARF